MKPTFRKLSEIKDVIKNTGFLYLISMAKASVNVIRALRNTAETLSRSNEYQWGHMGSCNCGFLAQEVTNLTKSQIHFHAILRHGDWCEQLNDYCPTSGMPMDELISEMLIFGFDTEDLRHLERLSDPSILSLLPNEERMLYHNVKHDVIRYLQAWATLLEDRLLKQIKLPSFSKETIL
jgi:hypothetical protein